MQTPIIMASLTIRAIPDELITYLLKEQFSNKCEKKIGQYSLEKTVIKIIKEHKELKEEKK